MSLSPPAAKSPLLSNTIDRQTTAPFLLNFCYRSSAFHNLADFPLPTPSNPIPHLPAHLQIYTWMSCTLKELAHLLTTALPSILPSPAVGTRLAFRLVYPDLNAGRGRGEGRLDEGRGRYVSREMGSVVIGAGADGYENGDGGVKTLEVGGEDAQKTLEDVRFVIGDFVDCAVFPPLSDGSVVSRGSVMGGAGGVRRDVNGFGRGAPRGGGFGRGRGGFGGGAEAVPSGEWRRGERLPDRGPGGGGGFGRGRGRY